MPSHIVGRTWDDLDDELSRLIRRQPATYTWEDTVTWEGTVGDLTAGTPAARFPSGTIMTENTELLDRIAVLEAENEALTKKVKELEARPPVIYESRF